MKAKVEITSNKIVKHNTARFSSGLEWVTERLSINHNREVRVYRMYEAKSSVHLKIPEAFELNDRLIKIEKLEKVDDTIEIPALIPSLQDFASLGNGERRNIFDFLSSPTQSILRGIFFQIRFLGAKIFLQALKHLFLLYLKRPRGLITRLIHKDLKKDQNMMATKSGVYFYDFGSSILTKSYFLTDIVELSTDHQNFTVELGLIKDFVSGLKMHKCNIVFLRSQIYLLLLRRYLHFHPVDRANAQKMSHARVFIGNLENLINKFELM